MEGTRGARTNSESPRENPMAALLLAAPAALLPALILLGRYERRTLDSVQGERAGTPGRDVRATIRVVNARVD